MGTEIFNIDASWAEKLMKTRVSFLAAPTVVVVEQQGVDKSKVWVSLPIPCACSHYPFPLPSATHLVSTMHRTYCSDHL